MDETERMTEMKKLAAALALICGFLSWLWTSNSIMGLIVMILAYLVIVKLSNKKNQIVE
ncbi:hypothetical protein ISS06_02155 [Patescibacteria group bacterium]|nr:hypothetical protein [Patescibacteria group bacterium]